MTGRRAHIVGVAESRYTRWGKIGDVTEHELACQAIQRAGRPATSSASTRSSGVQFMMSTALTSLPMPVVTATGGSL